jgi:phenylpyruvate tautomerase PptA (4-oxalocrotonate tautomerase family)
MVPLTTVKPFRLGQSHQQPTMRTFLIRRLSTVTVKHVIKKRKKKQVKINEFKLLKNAVV